MIKMIVIQNWQLFLHSEQYRCAEGHNGSKLQPQSPSLGSRFYSIGFISSLYLHQTKKTYHMIYTIKLNGTLLNTSYVYVTNILTEMS